MLSEGWLVKKVSYLNIIDVLFLVSAINVNNKKHYLLNNAT